MATGDSTDMLRRVKSLLPRGWFDHAAALRDVVLGGLSDGFAWAWSQLLIVRAGTRRAGTTGWLLDLDAWGFFGSLFLRRPDETDESWRKRYTDEIFRPKVTRPGVEKALYDLTGKHPVITELWNTGDVGAYGATTLAYAGGNTLAPAPSGYATPQGGYGRGSAAYGVRSRNTRTSAGAGAWGSLSYPYQIFITAYRPALPAIPYVAGYGTSAGGFGAGTITYADITDAKDAVSDADIYARVASVIGAGITAWVDIE